MTTTPHWQMYAAMDLDAPHSPKLRVSSAYKCERALTYTANGIEETDPPDEHGINRMALGHMAEILIIRDLENKGWEISHSVLSDFGQLELEFDIPGTDQTMTGHPDGICRHPEYTNNHWLTLECKSMSIDRAIQVESKGIAETYPGYIIQIGMYGRKLHEMGLVSHPYKGIFGLMDRDGRPLPPERVSWDPAIIDAILEKQATILNYVKQDTLPDRPYPPDSMECRLCNYHTLCRKTPAKGEDDDQQRKPHAPLLSKDPKVVKAATEWKKLKPQLDNIKNILQETSDDAGQVDVIADGVVAGYFQPRVSPTYNPDLLHKLVPADILRKCTLPSPNEKKAFWIRRERV